MEAAPAHVEKVPSLTEEAPLTEVLQSTASTFDTVTVLGAVFAAPIVIVEADDIVTISLFV